MFLLAKLTTSAGAWPGPNGGSAPARGTSAGSLVPEAREPALTTCLKEAGFCNVGLARAGGWTCRAELLRAARSGDASPVVRSAAHLHTPGVPTRGLVPGWREECFQGPDHLLQLPRC